MFSFFISVVEAFRGIDWFLLILLGSAVALNPVIGFIEGFNSGDDDFEDYMLGRSNGTGEEIVWDSYGLFLFYSTVIILLLIFWNNEKIENLTSSGLTIYSFTTCLIAFVFGVVIFVVHLLATLFSIIFGIATAKRIQRISWWIEEKYANFKFARERNFG